jgi:chorismate mutase
MIRAGVWKPRTRPGGFEGLGEPALRWMKEIADSGMRMSDGSPVRFCCEVARTEHVELCLHYGIDTVWLGARTTANPFMVGEIGDALRGSGLKVMVKNPVCPDVRLWIGAIERLQQVGIEQIAAVHRGFSMYNNHGYRNAPLWEVAMELRHERPELPILCDPSHMGGRADLVGPLARAAHQLDYDGLMVEVHPHPAEALTDAAQQITPQALADVIAHWATTPYPTSVAEAARALEPLRSKIDDIDNDLISLLTQRMAVSKRIASVKRDAHMPVYQQARWADMMNDRLHQATALGLEADFMKELLEKIHAESVRLQMEG